jgi:sialate O-acetylesterase
MGPENQNFPNNLYNGMIHGLIPVELQGAIWYQGEANAYRYDAYRTLFPSLIKNWRTDFEDDELDFFWVQLAAYGTREGAADRTWAFLRETQTQTLALPHTGEVVTLDIGNVVDIHPRNKLDVGRRLARLALNRTYGFDVPDSGPVFDQATLEGSTYRLSFTEIESGLMTPDVELEGFEIAGKDRVFHPAQAKIDGQTVVVSSDKVSTPIAVRYAWQNAPRAGLFNRDGLPATPFRTDDWE